MKKITVIIIAKNAQEDIGACIESVAFCDEIIVVDNESTDNTAEVAKKRGAKVYLDVAYDFSELRNFGMKKAESEWVLYVDADERVTSELARNIKYQISNIQYQNVSAYRIRRKNFYFGNHEWPYIERLERLFKKEKLKRWYGKLHESAEVDGLIGDMNGFLLHYTHKNLESMVEKTMKWSEIEAKLRFDAGHPKMIWWRFPRVMITAFSDSYVKQGGWKAGTTGIIESLYQAFSIFITYAKLWELQNEKKA